MSTMYGADVAELRALAGQFDRVAAQLDGDRAVVGNAIQVSAWVGPVAVRFRSEWASDHSRRVHDAAERLRHAASALRANADDQERTSAAGDGARSGLGLWPGHGKAVGFDAPTSAAGLVEALRTMNDKEDSFRIMRVRGADGKIRYIAYLAGTSTSQEMSLTSNVGAAGNEANHQMQAYVDRIKQEMHDHGDPLGCEVMLVGHSQGAMVAQTIADKSSLNVKSVITFGSPVLRDSNGYGGADIVRITAPNDPIPHAVDAARFVSVGQAYSDAVNSLAKTYSSQPYGAQYSFHGTGAGAHIPDFDLSNGAHSLANYEKVAAEFDSSIRNESAKAAMARFSGEVLDDKL